MAMPASGTITFAQLQTEFGGSHPITMGEYSAYRNAGSGNTISMSQYYGTSAHLDSQVVTVATSTIYYSTWNGYHSGNSLGSISDGTCDFKSGASIYGIYKIGFSQRFYFELSGTHANSGWTSMTVNNVSYARTSAVFGQSGGRTYWRWAVGSTNPFGTTSGNKTVTWA
tara:strand:+ start:264 stop:770 length:507 start_codon:yes stop_codon:yes gene_type:complete